MRDVIKQNVLPRSRRAVWYRCIKAKALYLWCSYAQAPLDKAGFPLSQESLLYMQQWLLQKALLE